MDKMKDTFKDLSMTNDEIKKLSDAFKNEEFRKLFREYAEELQDPENRRKYEEELTAMENERGMDVEFINPEPGHVLKTIQNGEKKIFVNICKSDKIEPAKVIPCKKNKVNGSQWSIPHSFSPPREDIDKKKDSCLIYDVVFNPQTYQKGTTDLRFRQMLHDTALQGIETAFHVSVDQKNVRVLKMKMKGCPTATVVRRKRQDYDEKQKDLLEKMEGPLKFPYPEETNDTTTMTYDVLEKTTSPTSLEEYTRPVYSIRYCDEFDIVNYVGEQVQHNLRPKKMIVDIKLPLVASAKSVDLDIDNTHLTLSTEKPVKYKLEIKFTYPILSDKGKAKFDKSTRVLKLDLPIEQLPESSSMKMDDSFFFEDPICTIKSPLIDDSLPLIENKEASNCVKVEENIQSLEDNDIGNEALLKEVDVERKTPKLELRCRTNNFFAFIRCDIKNVNNDDIKVIYDTASCHSQNIRVTFSTCGQGGWRTYYNLPLTLTLNNLEGLHEGEVTFRVLRDNVIIKVPLERAQVTAVSYLDQTIEFEKKNEYLEWKNIENVEDNDKINDDEEDTFKIASGNISKDTFKIICVPSHQNIDIDNAFKMEIEQMKSEEICIDEDVNNAELIIKCEHNSEDITEMKVETCIEKSESIEKEEIKEEIIVINKKEEESKEVEGLISSDYFEERRDPVHRTHCAVDLDERLLFDLE